jgi:hypothetical protein
MKVTWDYDPDTGILDITFKEGDMVLLTQTVTDPDKVAQTLEILREKN